MAIRLTTDDTTDSDTTDGDMTSRLPLQAATLDRRAESRTRLASDYTSDKTGELSDWRHEHYFMRLLTTLTSDVKT
jgi:hypothetical protein